MYMQYVGLFLFYFHKSSIIYLTKIQRTSAKQISRFIKIFDHYQLTNSTTHESNLVSLGLGTKTFSVNSNKTPLS